jgi:hypothetical protein
MTSANLLLRRAGLALLCASTLASPLSRPIAAQQVSPPGRRPLDYVNTLVGTAPLDDQKLIGT